MVKKIFEKKIAVTFDIKEFVNKHSKEEYLRYYFL